VTGGTDVVCVAQNDALLDGLLTLFHVERSSDALLNTQNDLPLLSDYDKECLATLGQEYEIDFVSLSYTRTMDDVIEVRRGAVALVAAVVAVQGRACSSFSLPMHAGICTLACALAMHERIQKACPPLARPPPPL
jgi:pyruvate kinase